MSKNRLIVNNKTRESTSNSQLDEDDSTLIKNEILKQKAKTQPE